MIALLQSAGFVGAFSQNAMQALFIQLVRHFPDWDYFLIKPLPGKGFIFSTNYKIELLFLFFSDTQIQENYLILYYN